MKIDALLPFEGGLSQVAAAAEAAEALGFDGVWEGETAHDPLLAQPLIAEHTTRLQFGTDISVAFARSPMVFAYTAWDLAAQSGGRFILGLGTQVKAHIERRFGMPWDAPVPRLREMILAIRAIWDTWQNGTPLNFRGQYYKITLMTPFFNPGPIAHPKVPIYIAGVNTALCRLAGEVADGFHVHPFHSIKFLREATLPAIAEGAGKSGRSRSDLELTCPVFTITDDVQRETVRRQISFYGATPTYRSVLDCHGWSATGERLSSLASRGRWDEMPREITDEMLETFATIAAPGELPEKLHEKYDGFLDRLALYEHFEQGKNDERWRSLIAWIRARS